MDYGRIYNDIIDNARDRCISENILIERHHIIPSSMNGTDDNNNLVSLSLREHFICHYLLYKIHKTQAMAFALHAMCMKRPKKFFTSHQYKLMRTIRQQNMIGEKNPMYGKKGPLSPNFGSNSPYYGKKLPEATRKKISLSRAGQPWTEAQRASRMEYHKNNPSAFKGKKHSQAAKDKMSRSRMGCSPWNKGIPMTQEQKDKLSKACLGRASTFKGKKHSKESKEKFLKTRYTKNLKKYNLIYPLDLDKYKRIKKAENDLYRQFRALKKTSK